jgi:hypothetical protein
VKLKAAAIIALSALKLTSLVDEMLVLIFGLPAADIRPLVGGRE